jgi:hypothetical protein
MDATHWHARQRPDSVDFCLSHTTLQELDLPEKGQREQEEEEQWAVSTVCRAEVA